MTLISIDIEKVARIMNSSARQVGKKPISANDYWEKRYRAGGTSGAGSENHLAQYKNAFLNRLVSSYGVNTVLELGCGDGQQLQNADYPQYYGVDVAPEAVSICQSLYKNHSNRRFLTIGNVLDVPVCDLSMSIDVVYHILDDTDYSNHLDLLFSKSRRFVVVYGNDVVSHYPARHVILRDVIGDIDRKFPEWRLVEYERNPYYSSVGTDPKRTWANFYVYARRDDPISEIFGGAPEIRPNERAIQVSNFFSAAPWTTSKDETVWEIPRDEGTLVAALELIQAKKLIDVSGWVTNAKARTENIYLAGASHPKPMAGAPEDFSAVIPTEPEKQVTSRAVPEDLGSSIPTDHARQATSRSMSLDFLKGRSPKRILDLGCGVGDSVDFFGKEAPTADWVGIDIEVSPEVASRSRSDAKFMTFDGVNIPFEDDHFDFIYSHQVFEHVRYPEKLLAEVARCLSADGIFVGSTSHLEPYHSYSLWNYTVYGFSTLLNAAGLKLTLVRPGIDGITLIQRSYRKRPKELRRYFVDESPLNQEIETVLGSAGKSIRDINHRKLMYCGHFVFAAERA